MLDSGDQTFKLIRNHIKTTGKFPISVTLANKDTLFLEEFEDVLTIEQLERLYDTLDDFNSKNIERHLRILCA